MIPSGFPVTHRFDVLDGNQGLRLVPQNFRQQVILGFDLIGFVRRVFEDFTIQVAKNVVAHPAHHFQIPRGKHRCQHRFHQCFACFPIATGVQDLLLTGVLIQTRQIRPDGRGKIHKMTATLHRGQGIECTRGDGGVTFGSQRLLDVEPLPATDFIGRWWFGGRDVHDDHPVKFMVRLKLRQVFGQS